MIVFQITVDKELPGSNVLRIKIEDSELEHYQLKGSFNQRFHPRIILNLEAYFSLLATILNLYANQLLLHAVVKNMNELWT